MGKEKFKFIRSTAIAVIITACLTISIQSILAAWTAPTIAPPDGNVSAPVNIGLLTQIKSGIFGITNDFYVGANTFFVDESGTGNVGIGTIAPSANLAIKGTAGQNPLYIASSTDEHLVSVDSGGRLRIGQFNSSWAQNLFDTGFDPNALIISGYNRDLALVSVGNIAGDKADIDFYRANGSIGAPTSVTSTTILGQINWHGYIAGLSGPYAPFTDRVVSIISSMDGSPTTTSLPTKLEFSTTNATTNPPSLSVQMTIKNDGNVGIGTTNPQTKLDVDGVIRTRPRSSATCDAANEGAIFYDSDTDDIKVCRSGGNWEKLAWQ